MASENEDLFEVEIDKFNGNESQKLPISLFQEIEADMCDRLMHGRSSPEDDQTDGPLEFIQNIVENVRSEFDNFIEDEGRKIFLKILTKIFTILFSVKADSTEKIIKLVKNLHLNSAENMVRTKLVPRRLRIRRWPPREPYVQFKIKTILPKQKKVQIKKKWTSH